MANAVLLVANALAMFACVAAVVLWGKVLYRRLVNQVPLTQSLLGAEARERPDAHATLSAAVIMYGSMLFVSGLMVAGMMGAGEIDAAESSGDAPSIRSMLLAIVATSCGGIVAATIALAWLIMKDTRLPTQLGLEFRESDLRLGMIAAVMLIPPVIVINILVSALTQTPYEHVVLDVLARAEGPAIYLAIFVSTVIVTPLVEEFMMRVLLQGGLQSLADQNPIVDQQSLVDPTPLADPTPAPGDWTPRAHWPVFAASLAFALMHLGQGAAPIPLFFLAIGLGYLYRQTGRITPSVIVHMVLNGMTVLVQFANPGQ